VVEPGTRVALPCAREPGFDRDHSWSVTTEEIMPVSRNRPTTNPFHPLLDDVLGSRGGGRKGDLMRTPDADVIEMQNEIRVMIELPGMRPEEIGVDLEGNVLTISGEKQEQRTEGDDANRSWHLSERRYGRFIRSFVLPRDVQQEKIEAKFENGVLTLTIPKSEKARRRRIEVRGGGGGGTEVG
jgi:HSP20 family protein